MDLLRCELLMSISVYPSIFISLFLKLEVATAEIMSPGNLFQCSTILWLKKILLSSRFQPVPSEIYSTSFRSEHRKNFLQDRRCQKFQTFFTTNFADEISSNCDSYVHMTISQGHILVLLSLAAFFRGILYQFF